MTTSRLNRYAVIEELGEGTFGKVFKARSKEDGRFVAIKVYKDLIGVAQFHNELEILKGVKNMTQYVVQYIDHFDDDIKHYLVLELAESSLFRELRKLEYINGLPESTLQQLVLQLGCALYFLAGKNIVHRDLKPGNILVWKTSSERYLFKLCDFGNSRVAAAEMDSIAGTVPYACPSVVSNCVNGDAGQPRAKYTACEADLWSLSTLIYHCSTGKQAFDVPRNSLHRNVDLDRLLSQRVPRAISGRLVHGKPTYATDLPHPCRYPKLFKEALVQYLAQLLDCKNSNFNFATNKEWATEFGQMRPSLIYHLHQCRCAL
ncbi:hypothetical protein QR680_003477 [Steinernema hermaphroditum]|uniref:IkappaB kinase n=1 Tax=Steinernema hermaphroditum TaxID=289476 RepID=A0AA39H6Z4_9BILA|nr:hypothetical protein QR680_003477 [Steinernema hermaphroditum]